MEVLEKIKELEKKALFYDSMKDRYVTSASGILDCANKLKQIALELDPYLNKIKIRGTKYLIIQNKPKTEE